MGIVYVQYLIYIYIFFFLALTSPCLDNIHCHVRVCRIAQPLVTGYKDFPSRQRLWASRRLQRCKLKLRRTSKKEQWKDLHFTTAYVSYTYVSTILRFFWWMWFVRVRVCKMCRSLLSVSFLPGGGARARAGQRQGKRRTWQRGKKTRKVMWKTPCEEPKTRWSSLRQNQSRREGEPEHPRQVEALALAREQRHLFPANSLDPCNEPISGRTQEQELKGNKGSRVSTPNGPRKLR